ncbi:uncharacterized protein BXIN_1538 [Babesia sp. Xinjiang]|uniref:uncharacterized protein n=1 Tax=Babesia sp. Xinjiang TaxID=462227 RepID=UPI000A25972F|nr:uncharacterized protein BXIN_1538 [Babesia sp. Xinjiang]ORM42298.1 hypothetical protein BXIN_1538 [Babesia sp. Xinjiang]
MRLFVPLCVFLHTVSVIATSWKQCRNGHRGFVAPASSLRVVYSVDKAKCLKRIQARAEVKSTLPDSASPNAVKPGLHWDRILLNTWKDHGASIVLGTIYGIRIFRFMLHIRNLLEWLPQANPYLFPFDAIYQATNAYVKFFQLLIPPFYGVDISGMVAFFVLERIEYLLAHKPGVAQVALN